MEGLKRLGERFDILHAHDHQAAWMPCFMRTHDAYEPAFGGLATIFTITTCSTRDSTIRGCWRSPGSRRISSSGAVFEFWGRVSSMKAGIAFADQVTTVSPRHAREIQTSGEFGSGSRRDRAPLARLSGILNGLDDAWDPATDPAIARRFDAARLELKAENRPRSPPSADSPGNRTAP